MCLNLGDGVLKNNVMRNSKRNHANALNHNKGSWKRSFTLILLTILLISTSMTELLAQCSLCTKTAEQLGDGPAAGLNKGILYLMLIPLSIMSFLGIKWYKKEKATRQLEDVDH